MDAFLTKISLAELTLSMNLTLLENVTTPLKLTWMLQWESSVKQISTINMLSHQRESIFACASDIALIPKGTVLTISTAMPRLP